MEGQGQQPTLLLRVKRRRDAAAPEEMILQQSSLKRSREDQLAAQMAALMATTSTSPLPAPGASQTARRRCRFARVHTARQGAVLGRSANDLIQLMQSPEFKGKHLHEVLQLLEHQEPACQQQQQQQPQAQVQPSLSSRTTFSAAAHFDACPSNQPGVQYMQLPRLPMAPLGSSTAAAATSAQQRPLEKQQQQQQQQQQKQQRRQSHGAIRLYDLVQVDPACIQGRLQQDRRSTHPAEASSRRSGDAGLAAEYESLLQDYLSSQQHPQQEQQASPLATPSPQLKRPSRRRPAQATAASAAPATNSMPHSQQAQPLGHDEAAAGTPQPSQGWQQWQEDEEYVYDVYLATEGMWAEALPAEAMEADDEGVPVVEVLTDDEDLLPLPPEAMDPDHDSEDSNAESFYANSYPDEDPSMHIHSSDDEGDDDAYCGRGDGGGSSRHGVARVPIYGRAEEEEEYDADEFEEQELQAAMMPGQLWRSRLLLS